MDLPSRFKGGERMIVQINNMYIDTKRIVMMREPNSIFIEHQGEMVLAKGEWDILFKIWTKNNKVQEIVRSTTYELR